MLRKRISSNAFCCFCRIRERSHGCFLLSNQIAHVALEFGVKLVLRFFPYQLFADLLCMRQTMREFLGGDSLRKRISSNALCCFCRIIASVALEFGITLVLLFFPPQMCADLLCMRQTVFLLGDSFEEEENLK